MAEHQAIQTERKVGRSASQKLAHSSIQRIRLNFNLQHLDILFESPATVKVQVVWYTDDLRNGCLSFFVEGSHLLRVLSYHLTEARIAPSEIHSVNYNMDNFGHTRPLEI